MRSARHSAFKGRWKHAQNLDWTAWMEKIVWTIFACSYGERTQNILINVTSVLVCVRTWYLQIANIRISIQKFFFVLSRLWDKPQIMRVSKVTSTVWITLEWHCCIKLILFICLVEINSTICRVDSTNSLQMSALLNVAWNSVVCTL